MKRLTFLLAFSLLHHTGGFLHPSLKSRTFVRFSATVGNAIEEKVTELKRVLSKEYVSFFDPMETDYYKKDVTFDDPMTSLEGVQGYQNNVDMLASRTFLGSILFKDAGIVLHSVEGGSIKEDGSIEDIITRWTLRLTAKILPWTPTARFTGISVYKVEEGGPKGIEIVGQTDYWDSVNIKEGGGYEKVEKTLAISDFVDQLKPGVTASIAGEELPYQLLRRGSGYEVRRYPTFCAVETEYGRRDDGFALLGSFSMGKSKRPSNVQ